MSRWPAVLILILVAASCAPQNGYRQAFSSDSAAGGNTAALAAPVDQVFDAAKLALVKQGFNVQNADESNGLISAQREMADQADSGLSYLVSVTATVDKGSEPNLSQVAVAANEQTIRHQKYHTWWHLLWIVPLFPDGTQYNTVVRQEQTVTDPKFYADFFEELRGELPKETAKAAAHSEPAGAVTSGTTASNTGQSSASAQ